MIMKKEIVCLLGLIISTICLPLMTEINSLVISTTTETTNLQADGQSKEKSSNVAQIYEMNVHTNVSNRFAKTVLTSKVRNVGEKAREATFSVIIPDQAYISGFIMEIDGKKYQAYIEEKEKAKETYNKAVASGRSAGHVAVSARDSNRFTVSINIEPEHKAIFYLTYEELLARQHDKYEVVLNIHPGQLVEKLDILVQISESRPLKFVEVQPLRSGNEISMKENTNLEPDAKVDMINDTTAIVHFNPNMEKQKTYADELGSDKNNGLAGQFVVQYDVERDPHGGEVLVDGGHFVHFFAPSDLPALPKHVIFILDTSTSMLGTRLSQVVEAMKKILIQLREEDIFNIVEFNSIAKVLNIGKSASQLIPSPSQATRDNIESAKKVVEKLTAEGSTNIEDALEKGIGLIKTSSENEKQHQPIIIFLTDGQANTGDSDTDSLTSTISELNAGRCAIFSLSFGDDADRAFLQKLSIKNLGFARHIYEAADASLQLENFYKEISSPLLSNVTFKYVNNVTDVTKTNFPVFFHGKELVVAGAIDSAFAVPEVVGWGTNGPINLKPVVSTSVGSLERLWAYLTLKQILEKRGALEDKTNTTKEAVDLALKYSFVSDVSSLVVVKPNVTDAVITKDASKDEEEEEVEDSQELEYPQDQDYENIDITTLYWTTTITVSESPTTWLDRILNGNGTITLSSGVYQIGSNKSITTDAECSKTPRNTIGKCTLIKDCRSIHPLLVDVETYEKYFCNLEGLAGVCCPTDAEV